MLRGRYRSGWMVVGWLVIILLTGAGIYQGAALAYQTS
jgi:hypothetical protein